MTYDQLMHSLDSIKAMNNYGALLVILICIFTLSVFIVSGLISVSIQKMKKATGSFTQRFKKGFPLGTLIPLLILISLAIISVKVGNTQVHKGYTLEEKKTQPSSDIDAWEEKNQDQLRKYFKTLPQVTIPLAEVELNANPRYDNGTVTFKDPKTKKEVQANYLEEDVFNVREEDLKKDEPKESHLTYVKLPHDITYNYQKGDIVVLEIVKIK